jgi:poly-gamma-glutamate system protein
MRLARMVFSDRRGFRTVAFLLVGAIALGAYALALRFPDGSVPPWVLAARRQAVHDAVRGQQVIRQARATRGLPFSSGDRLRTGMVGVESSPITTELGSAPSKRTSTDPLFAAAVVDMLYRAGVRPGDVVAAGKTGSFPALDLDVAVAVEAMGATPVTISSVGASQWGANDPALGWLEMERVLLDAGVIHHRSLEVAPGGTEVVGGVESPEDASRRSLAGASGLPVIPVMPLDEEVAYRMEVYRLAAGSQTIRAFVNVGASAADLGAGTSGDTVVEPGLSRPNLSGFQVARLGVVGQMAARGVPIVNLLDVSRLAQTYGIPWDPTARPAAHDLPGPPPHPIAISLALALVFGVVVAAHRLGLFRVPDWEMPEGLRDRWRTPAGPADHALEIRRAVASARRAR